jgi:hypothetical protein
MLCAKGYKYPTMTTYKDRLALDLGGFVLTQKEKKIFYLAWV